MLKITFTLLILYEKGESNKKKCSPLYLYLKLEAFNAPLFFPNNGTEGGLTVRV